MLGVTREDVVPFPFILAATLLPDTDSLHGQTELTF